MQHCRPTDSPCCLSLSESWAPSLSSALSLSESSAPSLSELLFAVVVGVNKGRSLGAIAFGVAIAVEVNRRVRPSHCALDCLSASTSFGGCQRHCRYPAPSVAKRALNKPKRPGPTN